ncbi:SpoIIE family protein phosphatase [Synechococcus sp. CS-1328]|nr:SpoIIE family protein phosphatase [Synechococcus sp. CS-1328]
MEKVLNSAGYTVFTSPSGADGLEQVARNQPQIVICDWQMQPMDGLEICHRIKSTPGSQDTFFCLLTSRSSLEDRVTGLDAGADDFLSKPVAPDELLARVRSAVRLVRANERQRLLLERLQRQTDHLNAELAQAAAYVNSLLPGILAGSPRIQSLYLPSTQLGGDCYDYYWLDADHLLLYLLDVSGHGLSAALTSISVHNLLRSTAISRSTLLDPALLLTTLNGMFQMEKQNSQYFTMWCGIYHAPSRQLTYASGGHPPALCFSPAADRSLTVSRLTTGGMAIGLFEDADYSASVFEVPAHSSLLLYSDGVYELPCNDGSVWTLDGFVGLASQLQKEHPDSIEVLIAALRGIASKGQFNDDCSIVQAAFA